VKWASDGNWLASAADDQTVRVWNGESGACVSIVQGTNDLFTVLPGSEGVPSQLSRANVHETEILSSPGGHPVAWHFRPINLSACPTSPRLFAGFAGTHVYLLSIEGDV
jgi:WD40 repeat protein